MPSSQVKQLLPKINKLRKQGKSIVFTNGCFDLIHAGHVRLLNKAKQYGDILIVAVNSDSSLRKLKGPGRPILNIKDRLEILKNLKCVDFAVPFREDTPFEIIRDIQPDVIVKGGDYSEEKIVGGDIVKSRGGKVVSGIFVKGRSTTGIISKIKKIR